MKFTLVKSSVARASVPALLGAALIAGCGGGGGGASISTLSSDRSNSLTAVMSMLIPPAGVTTLSKRSAKFISPSTQSVAVSGIYGSTSGILPFIVDVSPSSPNCAPITGGGRLCTVSVQVLRGVTGLQITAYDLPQGQGNALAQATVDVPATNADVVNVSVTLLGVVRSLQLKLSGGSFVPGQGGTKTLMVLALDADGNAITGPGGYANSINLLTSDASVTIIPNVVTDPSQVVIAIYNGAANASTGIGATMQGSAPVSALAITAVGNGTPAPLPSVTPNPGSTAIVVIKGARR